nr:hypothetical protein [uncultured Glaciecola sp.]
MSNNKESASVAALTATEKLKSNAQTQDIQQHNYKPNLCNLPFYRKIEDVTPEKLIGIDDFLAMVKSPSISDKQNAAALTPYNANGKQKQDAINAQYHAIIVDHDDDDLTKEQLRAKYDHFNINYIAFSTSSHLQDKKGVIGNRWKVVIPLADPINQKVFCAVSLGITLLMKADLAQVRTQQVFFAPNKISEQAPYDYIVNLDAINFDVENKTSELMERALSAYKEHEQDKQKIASKAASRPKDVSINNNSIIGLVNDAYDLESVILAAGYKKQGKKYLSPFSESGLAGVIILDDKLYSHHGESDPLSSLNHDGHALDTFDVLCCLNHSGDVSAAIKHYANELDQEGQKERQRQHMESENEISQEQLNSAEIKNETFNAFVLPSYPDDLLSLPYQLGEIQTFIYNRMTYPSAATAGIAALATLTAFAQTNITIDSRDGLGLNEQYMILAPTGFGKEDLRNPIQVLLKEARSIDGVSSIIKENTLKLSFAAPSSPQGLHQILENSRSTFFLSDEFAEWLRLSHSDSHKQAALGYLMQIYTKALGVIEPGHAASHKYEQVTNPRVGILATSTSEAILSTMTREQADSGAYNRWIMFVGEQDLPQKRYKGLVYKPEKELVEFISEVLLMKKTVIKFSSAGFEEYIKLDNDIAEPVKRKDGVLGGRLSEQAIKLAAIIAISDQRTQIEPKDLQIAFSIRVGLYERTRALVAHEGSLSGMHKTGEAMAQVETLLRKNEFLYKSALRAKSRKYAALSVPEQQAVLRSLQDNGIIRPVKDNPKMIFSGIYEN